MVSIHAISVVIESEIMKSIPSTDKAPALVESDKRVIEKAWDAAIYRHRSRPVYHFQPREPGDSAFADRLGVTYCEYGNELILIHLPEGVTA